MPPPLPRSASVLIMHFFQHHKASTPGRYLEAVLLCEDGGVEGPDLHVGARQVHLVQGAQVGRRRQQRLMRLAVLQARTDHRPATHKGRGWLGLCLL